MEDGLDSLSLGTLDKNHSLVVEALGFADLDVDRGKSAEACIQQADTRIVEGGGLREVSGMGRKERRLSIVEALVCSTGGVAGREVEPRRNEGDRARLMFTLVSQSELQREREVAPRGVARKHELVRAHSPLKKCAIHVQHVV